MRTNRSRHFLLASSLSALALFAAGCSDDDNSTTETGDGSVDAGRGGADAGGGGSTGSGGSTTGTGGKTASDAGTDGSVADGAAGAGGSGAGGNSSVGTGGSSSPGTGGSHPDAGSGGAADGGTGGHADAGGGDSGPDGGDASPDGAAGDDAGDASSADTDADNDASLDAGTDAADATEEPVTLGDELLTNGSFDDGTGTWASSKLQSIPGWSESGDADASFEQWAGAASDNELGHWYGSAYSVSTYQTLTGLTAGSYVLSVEVQRGQSPAFTVQNIYATCGSSDAGADAGVEVTKDITATNASGWTQVSLTVTVTGDTCTVGIHSEGAANAWANFNDASFKKIQ